MKEELEEAFIEDAIELIESIGVEVNELSVIYEDNGDEITVHINVINKE